MVSALQSSKAQQRKRNQVNTMVQKKKKNTTTNNKTTRKGKEKIKDAPTDQQKKEKRKKKVMSDEELKVFLEVIELQQKMEGKIKWTDINRTYFHGKFSANFLFQKFKRTIKPQEHKLTWCVESELELLLLVPRYTSQDNGEISWATLLKEEFFDSESISCTQLNNKYKSILKPTKKNTYLEKMLLEMTEKEKNLLMSTRRTMRRQRVLSKEFISLKQPRVHDSNSSSSSPQQRVQQAGFKPKNNSSINQRETRANKAKQKEPSKREASSRNTNSGPPRRKRRLVVDDSETGESDYETTPETKKPAKKKSKTFRHSDDDETSNESLRPQRQQHQKVQVNIENNRESEQKRGELYRLDEPTRRVTRSQMAAKTCPDKFNKINYCESEEEELSMSENEMDYELPSFNENSCWQEEEEEEEEQEQEEEEVEVELQSDVVTTSEPFIESKRDVEREYDQITSLEEVIHEEEGQREDQHYVLPIAEREEPVLDYEPSLFEGSDTPEDHTLIHDPATDLTREDIFGVGEELNIEHDEELGNQFIWDLKTMDPIPDVCSLDSEISAVGLKQQPKEPGTKEQKKEPFCEYDDEDDDQIIGADYYSTSCTPMTAYGFSEDEILHSDRFD